MNLSLAMLFVKDLERATAFYRDGVGLPPVPEASSPGFVVFEGGGARFALHAIPAEIASRIEMTDPPQARSETPIKLVFETPDLEADCARLVAAGATLLDRRWAGSQDLLDPEGNVFQVREAP
jgi:predicted enzyme related to lactoylglutathione lyase